MARKGAGVVAVIPARGGSKGVPGKNLRPVGGYPLIAYSIAAAELTPGIDRAIVSTDSPEIADIAGRFGGEVPFLRPGEFATDRSPDIGFVLHLTGWLKEHEGSEPEYVVNLRPTTPLRDPAVVDAAITAIRSRPDATSLRSVQPLPEPPQKMMGIRGGFLTGLFPDDPRPEYFNLPRQAFPPAYHPNGYVDIYLPMQAATGSLHGPRILGHVTPTVTEIDTPEDMAFLEYTLGRSGHPLQDYLRETFGRPGKGEKPARAPKR
ncbi:MAG TPA: acylneuraminate cytidylyltransferase family protein [Methanomicrobiales archaeon]|nr:acylneuraminate cytidylyltransferase family protein [Methanomicrobiales archaeon]